MFICLSGQWDIDGMGAFIDDVHKGGGFKNMRKFAGKHCVIQGEKDFWCRMWQIEAPNVIEDVNIISITRETSIVIQDEDVSGGPWRRELPTKMPSATQKGQIPKSSGYINSDYSVSLISNQRKYRNTLLAHEPTKKG